MLGTGELHYGVVRSFDGDGNIHMEIFGFDRQRFRWVRLTHPVNLGPEHDLVGWAQALTVFTLVADGAMITVGAGMGVVAAFASANPVALLAGPVGGGVASYYLGRLVFSVATHDRLAPVPETPAL